MAFVKERGFPAWDNASAFYQTGLPIMLVPVTQPAQNKVSGIIFITMNDTQPVYRWVPRDSEPEGFKENEFEQLMLIFEHQILGAVQTPDVKVKSSRTSEPIKERVHEEASGAVLISWEVCGSVDVGDDGDFGDTQCTRFYRWVSAIDSGGGGGFGGSGGEIPGGGSSGEGSNIEKIETLVEADKFALLAGPCEEILTYKALAEFTPTDPAVVNKLKDLENFSSAIVGAFDILKIEEAKGTVVNLDEFSVKINFLPNGMTADGLLNNIRTNINDFVNTSYGEFSPYTLVSNYPYNEAETWYSNDPLGSIMHIGINPDDGSVIVSDYSPSSWTFSTISAPYDWDHPVSGNREFGYTENSDGSYTFYTRGVDRFTQKITGEVPAAVILGDPFSGGDELWKSFQKGIKDFVNSHGGSATINEPDILRPDWNELRGVFLGTESIETLGCEENE